MTEFSLLTGRSLPQLLWAPNPSIKLKRSPEDMKTGDGLLIQFRQTNHSDSLLDLWVTKTMRLEVWLLRRNDNAEIVYILSLVEDNAWMTPDHLMEHPDNLMCFLRQWWWWLRIRERNSFDLITHVLISVEFIYRNYNSQCVMYKCLKDLITNIIILICSVYYTISSVGPIPSTIMLHNIQPKCKYFVMHKYLMVMTGPLI